MSLYSTSRTRENSSHSTGAQQHSELKQQIKKFLESAAIQSQQPHQCSRCGAEMKYIDTTFSLLGTSSAWNIKVPVCGCNARNSGGSSSSDGTETDNPLQDGAEKNASAA